MHNSMESSHGQTVVEGAGNDLFSEAEARKQSWVTLGILAMADYRDWETNIKIGRAHV